MDVQDVVEKLRSHKEVMHEFSISLLSVFGSVVRGESEPESDVDILVEFLPDAHIGLFQFARLQRKLSEIIGRPVDLTTPDALHPAMRDRILREAVHAA